MKASDLRQSVLDELEFEPSIDAAHIGVATSDGVVTLSGYVSTFAQKKTAEAAARRVRGVRAVADEIEVRNVGHKTTDDEIAQRAVNMLRWNASVPAEAIQVTVDRGWLTLTGEVRWQYQRLAAEEAVRRLPDVIGVANNISIKPVPEAGDIKSKIEAALKRRAEVEAMNITVAVKDGGRVVLNGRVDNWDERQFPVSSRSRIAWSSACSLTRDAEGEGPPRRGRHHAGECAPEQGDTPAGRDEAAVDRNCAGDAGLASGRRSGDPAAHATPAYGRA
jgi:osmotically-inducible protein OsmY